MEILIIFPRPLTAHLHSRGGCQGCARRLLKSLAVLQPSGCPHISGVTWCDTVSEMTLLWRIPEIKYLFSINYHTVQHSTLYFMLNKGNNNATLLELTADTAQELCFNGASLKQKCCHFDGIFITGCTESCQNYNFQHSQWRKCHQIDVSASMVLSDIHWWGYQPVM